MEPRSCEQLVSLIFPGLPYVLRASRGPDSAGGQATAKLRRYQTSSSHINLGGDATRRMRAPVLPEKKQSFYNRLSRLRPLVRGSDRLAESLIQKTLHVLAIKRFPLLARRLAYQHRQFNNSKDVEQLAE